MRKWMMVFFGIVIINGMLVVKLKANEVRQELSEVESGIVSIGLQIKENYYHYGTGFIVSSEGYIITCEHVIRHYKERTLTVFMNNKPCIAEVIRLDRDYDVAVLKIEGSNFSFLDIDDSEEVKPLLKIVCGGYPYTKTTNPSFLEGIVSKIIEDGKTEITKKPRKFIRIDKYLNPGFSGGPVFYKRANGVYKVIGIVKSRNATMYEGVQAISGTITVEVPTGFSDIIPINVARQLLSIGTSSMQESAKIHIKEEMEIQKKVNFEVYLNDKKIADEPFVFKGTEKEIEFSFNLRLTGGESVRDTYFHVIFPKMLNVRVENPWIPVDNINNLHYQNTISVIYPSMKGGITLGKIWIKFPAIGRYEMLYVIQSEKTDEIKKSFTIQIE